MLFNNGTFRNSYKVARDFLTRCRLLTRSMLDIAALSAQRQVPTPGAAIKIERTHLASISSQKILGHHVEFQIDLFLPFGAYRLPTEIQKLSLAVSFHQFCSVGVIWSERAATAAFSTTCKNVHEQGRGDRTGIILDGTANGIYSSRRKFAFCPTQHYAQRPAPGVSLPPAQVPGSECA